MQLSDLITGEIPIETETVPETGCEITAMTADSRQVEPGTLFAAMPGFKTDGRAFIADAVAKGAAAILTTDDAVVPAGLAVPILRSSDVRRALARLAARFYGRQPETVVAVTGTSGKTSVADFTRQLYGRLGHAAASIGTIGVIKPDAAVYGALTTPDPVTLAGVVAALADEGVTHLAFEASSHGLDQRRLDGMRLAAAAFTNLGRDHLDYHPTSDAYLAAKMRLFDTLLPPDATAVIYADDPVSNRVIAVAREKGLRVLTVGQATDADIRLAEARKDGFEQHLSIRHANQTYTAKLNLIGSYQAINALVAAGLVIATGEDPAQVFAGISDLQGVLGRLEVVGVAHGAPIVIDYAHKPDALAAALDALRPFAENRLICVFGCGGDRDRGKRAIMGAISRERADVTVVTDDNPRTEDADAIRAEILAGHPDATEIGNRLEAITAAITQAGPGDLVLIAGKGHETGQIVGAGTVPFSDHEAVATVLREL